MERIRRLIFTWREMFWGNNEDCMTSNMTDLVISVPWQRHGTPKTAFHCSLTPPTRGQGLSQGARECCHLWPDLNVSLFAKTNQPTEMVWGLQRGFLNESASRTSSLPGQVNNELVGENNGSDVERLNHAPFVWSKQSISFFHVHTYSSEHSMKSNLLTSLPMHNWTTMCNWRMLIRVGKEKGKEKDVPYHQIPVQILFLNASSFDWIELA